MRKYLSTILCLILIALTFLACGENRVSINGDDSTIFSTEEITKFAQEETVVREPMEVLTEAGLPEDLINTYFMLVNDWKLSLPAEEYVKLAGHSNVVLWAYLHVFGSSYTVDEYIVRVDELIDAGLSGNELQDYDLFTDSFTLDDYVGIVKELKSAGLTGNQITDYFRVKDQLTKEEYIKIVNDMTDVGLTEYQITRYFTLEKADPETYISFCLNYEKAEDVLNYYHYFEERFSLKEHVDLINRICESTGEQAVVPIYWLSDNLIFVRRNISTYDHVEESIAIMTLNGEMVTGWNAEWGEYDIVHRAECGDYFFIITKGYIYDYYDCDVVTRDGRIIASVHCKANRYDIGEGYVFFSLSNDWGNIMTPTGEVIALQTASVSPSYCKNPSGELEDTQAIGKISEGLFYGFSEGNLNTVAYYYNTQGEVVIDLSTQAVNFKVTKLYDFEDGQARVEFTGADYKQYYAYIDKNGAFVGDPIEIAE